MQLVANTLIAGSFAALMAAGLTLVYGVLGVFNMALGQLALVSGFVTWWGMNALGVPFFLSAPLGLLVGGIVTYVGFEVFVAPYYKRHRFLPLVTTIAFSMILDATFLLLFGEEPKTITIASRTVLHIGSAAVTEEQLFLIIATLVFLAVLAWVLIATPWGRRIRASVEHPAAAESLGINSFVLHRIVFVFSGLLAGLAGIYQGVDQNINPTLGFPITIKAYAALIAAGKKSLAGTILCAYGIALLEQLSIGVPWFGGHYIAAGFQQTVALLIIILILLWKPEGLFGSRHRAA